MDDQNEAWRRLTDARLKTLEAAVQPRRIRRTRKGLPLPAPPYEPGDRKPLTKWLELRLLAIELLLRLILDADEGRAGGMDVEGLEGLLEEDLSRLETWSEQQMEPDFVRQETIAMIFQARIILLEAHTWPLMAMEDPEGWE